MLIRNTCFGPQSLNTFPAFINFSMMNSGLLGSSRSYLCFGQIQLSGQLGALAAYDVLAPLELELEPVQLLGREGGPRALRPVQVEAFGQDDLPDGAFGVCSEEKGNTVTIFFLVCRSLSCTCAVGETVILH